MNLSPAETPGYSTLIETLAAPQAAPHEGAPETASFQVLLCQPESAEAPAAPSEEGRATTDAASLQEIEEGRPSSDKPTEAAQEEREPVEESSEEPVAVAVPVMSFQPMIATAVVSESIEVAPEPAVVGVSTAAQPRAATAVGLPDMQAAIPAEGEAQDELVEEQLPAVLASTPIDGLLPAEQGEQPLLTAEAGETSAAEVSSGPFAAESGSNEDQEDAEPSNRRHDAQRESPPVTQAAPDVPAAAGSGENLADANQATPAVAGGGDLRVNSDQPLPGQAGAPTPFQAAPQPAARLPAELVAPPGTQNNREPQTVQVDTVRLLQRVARAFSAAQDSGEVRIRLSPPELGALRMEVRVLEGALVARLETETAAARTAIVENLPALRERLAEQGVRIERFDVDLMQRHSGGSPDQPADHQPPEPLPPSPALRPRRMPQVAEGVVARHVIASDLGAGRLNVIV